MSEVTKSKIFDLIVIPDDGNKPILKFISSAHNTLRVKQFKLTEPSLIQALLDAHKRGVNVKVMLNPKADFGGAFNDETFAALQAAGIDTRWTNDRFAISHEKSIVVDDEKALLSSFNLCGTGMGATRDFGVITHDACHVAEISACFDADWNRTDFDPQEPSDLVWSSNNSRQRLCQFIDAATTSLDIQHPKWVDAVVLDRVLAALKRGVRVHLLCGGKHGVHEYHVFDCFSSWRILQRSGAKVRRQTYIKLHAKLMIADNKTVFFGSCNIDRAAFDQRRELSILISDKALVHRMAEVFQRDWNLSAHYDIPDPLCPKTHSHGELEHDPDFGHE